ncbi:MAG TPA: RDD family protein [Pyrinomonadaceae bacterium]|nr:RDD family protein [Acidobacteriota bacterium]HQZ96270.1 RDD family protein [Pyrinomonadaceae bacterium]
MPKHIIETEETLIIETPERVQLEFALASIGNRFLAVAIDHFIQYFTIILVAWFALSLAGFSSSDIVDAPDRLVSEMPKWTIAILIITLFLIFAGYFIAFEWLWNGQTPGKRLMKLRVIRDDGRPLTLWEAIARNLLRIGDAVPGFVLPVYSVGLIVIFLSGRDQRLGDIFAGTVVVRERTDEAPTFAETFSNRVTDIAFTRVHKSSGVKANVSLLTEREVEVVESFLRRRWDLTERQRLWMAWRIALPIMYKLKPGYNEEDFSYEGFLEEILHSFHAKQRFLN